MQNKKYAIAFRCDGNSNYGLGHIYRCITLANKLSQLKYVCNFFLSGPQSLKKYIISQGHRVNLLDETVNEEKKIPLKKNIFDLVIIDTKIVNCHHIKNYKFFAPVVYFDDLGREDLPVDILINNHFWANKKYYKNLVNSKILLGIEYNTINPEYFKQCKKKQSSLLITMGGNDEHENTIWLLENISELLNDFEVFICIGPMYKNKGKIIKLAKDNLNNYKIYNSPNTLIEIMKKCSFSLSASGTTCYELAAARVVMGLFVDDDDQTKLHKKILKEKIGFSLGTFKNRDINLVRKVFRLFKNQNKVDQIIKNEINCFKESGVLKLAKFLDEYISNIGNSKVNHVKQKF